MSNVYRAKYHYYSGVMLVTKLEEDCNKKASSNDTVINTLLKRKSAYFTMSTPSLESLLSDIGAMVSSLEAEYMLSTDKEFRYSDVSKKIESLRILETGFKIELLELKRLGQLVHNNAIEFIKIIAESSPEVKKPIAYVKDALEDGEALMYLGVTDEDQELVETAHEIVCGWIDEGRKFLNDCL